MAMTTAQKLRIKAGDVIQLVNTPADYQERLGDLPADVRFTSEPAEKLAAVHLQVGTVAELSDRFAELLPQLSAAGRVWIIYTRKKSYAPGDANRDSIWQHLKTRDWTAVANYPIDNELSAVWAKPVS